ncbi:MAG: NADH pyrophosphatase [Vezdaea acicularis]|nr:MAG: NADH pyrophosphatase [Vezdaea acicularis]
MPEYPQLPEPAQPDLDSMLSRKFGKEIANYFSGSPLNRVSFLRTDHAFLSKALVHPTASFLLLKDLAPLVQDETKLEFASYKDVTSLIGQNPFSKEEAQIISEYDSSVMVPILVFLGLDEQKRNGVEHLHASNTFSGVPYFALDITPKGSIETQANTLIKDMQGRGLTFLEGRHHMKLSAQEAAIYAQGRSFVDWNSRNPFCAQCGQPTFSINAGTKRTCPPTDMSLVAGVADTTTEGKRVKLRERPPCATRKGIHNIAFPRTDATVIMAVVSHDSHRILIGRQKRWPQHWYSTLAGFVEPAESIEEAVRREVWEEAGVNLGRVVVHSTQPWPYPANLMIGAIAQATPDGENIALKNDPELEDAKWVAIEEIAEALKVGTSGLGEEPPEGYKEGGLRLPPPTAIANQLLRAIADGFLGSESKL